MAHLLETGNTEILNLSFHCAFEQVYMERAQYQMTIILLLLLLSLDRRVLPSISAMKDIEYLNRKYTYYIVRF